MITLLLPKPPSVNELHQRATNGRVFRTKKYRAWMSEAGWQIFADGNPGRVTEPYTLHITLAQKGRRGDADNRIKAICDLLVWNSITPDDRFCERATAEWGDAPEGMCRVVISPVSQSRAA